MHVRSTVALARDFVVPEDTALRIRLDDTLTSTDSQVGDPFSATVVDQGDYRNARVYGHVTEIDMSGKTKGRTSLMLRFDRLVMPDGRRAPIHAEIVELYHPPSGEKVDVEGAIESGSRGRKTIEHTIIGTGAGALLGWNLRWRQRRGDRVGHRRRRGAGHHRLSWPSEDHAQQWSGDDDPRHALRSLRSSSRTFNTSDKKGQLKMRNLKTGVFVCVGLLGSMLPQAKADEWDQKTVFTFSGQVEIPGQVLNAGTYVFKLSDSQSDRNIVQVFNKNENHLYGTFLTVPDHRLKPRGKPIITFEERTSGSPEAVRAWFYPGENYGHQFVYTKAKAVQLAKANNTPVASMPDELAANTTKPAPTMQEPHVVEMKQAPLKAQQPTEEEVELTEVFAAEAPAPAPPPDKLPTTASSLPLIGLLGVYSLARGCLLSLLNARYKKTK